MTCSPTPSGHGGDQGVWRAMNAVAAPVAEKVAPTAQASPRSIEDLTGWPIERFVRTARRYRAIQIRVGTTASQPKRVAGSIFGLTVVGRG